MGLESVARSTLTYGVVIEIPDSPHWHISLLKNLRDIKEEKMPAATITEGDEPTAKRARAIKSILADCGDVEDEEESDASDEMATINYLSDHKNDMEEAARNAMDKALGLGHGLVLKAYYGHDEDSCAVSLLLQIEDDHSDGSPCSVSSFEGVSMTQVFPALQNQEKTDTLIKKALDVFGLKAHDDKPQWIMATECKLFR